MAVPTEKPAWSRARGPGRRGVLAGIVVLVASACGARAPAPTGADKGAPRLVGRFDRGDPAGPRFAWSGSTVEVRFRGRAIAVRLRAEPLPRTAAGEEPSSTYAVVLDGRAMPPLDVHAGEGRYVVAEGLDPQTVHELALTRDAEARGGVHQLLGVDVADGAILPARVRPHAIEVIGDSIACGYGVLGGDASCPFTFATERASVAWPALVRRKLDADVTTVCWSGRGVLRNYDGTTSGTMPELYARTLPASPPATFDFAAERQPDAVIVALGTNDFLGGKEPLDTAAFEAAYGAFLARIRALRPRATILVLESPMLPPEAAGSFPGDVKAAARASLARVVAQASGLRVSLVEVPWQGPRRGCDHHPNAEVHREIAARVAAALAL